MIYPKRDLAASPHKKRIDNILLLPYTHELVRKSDGTWFARVVEFPGCTTEGESQAEALANLETAVFDWLEIGLEERERIPEPLTIDSFSGKFSVRVSKSLHRALARHAELEGVSLNQFVSAKLSLSLHQPMDRGR